MFDGMLREGKPIKTKESGGFTLAYDSPPQVCEAAAPFLSAFNQLMGQRHVDGMGAVGEIRYEAVTDWLNENQVKDHFERERYRHYVNACDRAYLSMVAEKREREHKKMEAQAKKVKR